ncbi:hypothetical protein TIFTF001_040062 [Ficus carica]|uniref:Uncharacterized protein n=1 Tax=Ficus carica TaxID=3494 RepID=A0AA87YSC8_FICCA|nr:hypothetical protein TIFTF001_040062 [Ficus carica]
MVEQRHEDLKASKDVRARQGQGCRLEPTHPKEFLNARRPGKCSFLDIRFVRMNYRFERHRHPRLATPEKEKAAIDEGGEEIMRSDLSVVVAPVRFCQRRRRQRLTKAARRSVASSRESGSCSGSYLPYVLIRASEIKREERKVKIYSQECLFGASDNGDSN